MRLLVARLNRMELQLISCLSTLDEVKLENANLRKDNESLRNQFGTEPAPTRSCAPLLVNQSTGGQNSCTASYVRT
jgi:hypothetical protein